MTSSATHFERSGGENSLEPAILGAPSVVALSQERLVLDQLAARSWSRENYSSVFYSGRENNSWTWRVNRRGAFLPFGNRLITIEETEGGKWLKKQIEHDLIAPENVAKAWDEASRLFAESAEGDVTAFVLGANSVSLIDWIAPSKPGELGKAELKRETLRDFKWLESIWHRIELPTLLQNARVTSINGISREKLLQVWRSYPNSAIGLARISKDLGEALLYTKAVKSSKKPPGSNGSDGGKFPTSQNVAWERRVPAADRAIRSFSALAEVTAGSPKVPSDHRKIVANNKIHFLADPPSAETQERCRQYGCVPGGVILSSRMKFDGDIIDWLRNGELGSQQNASRPGVSELPTF